MAKRPEPLRTAEEVRNWLVELVEVCEDRRAACDVPFPKDRKTKVREQDRALLRYYMAHGQALGALGMALRSKQIEDVLYNELVNRVQISLLPTKIGTKNLGRIGSR